MLNGRTMSLDKLRKLSVIFGYNFFADLSGLLDLPGPVQEDAVVAGHSACNERIRELEIENRTLLMVLKNNKDV